MCIIEYLIFFLIFFCIKLRIICQKYNCTFDIPVKIIFIVITATMTTIIIILMKIIIIIRWNPITR